MSIMQGFLNIYKQSGDSSAKVVALVKKLSGVKKVGHMGTLDPMACGILPIALNKATRMFDCFLQKIKSYRAVFTFGYETDTLDALGKTIYTSNILPLKQQIEEILPSFLGVVNQVPPKYSAKNVNGVRAYELARKGKNIELASKQVEIKEFKLVKQIDDKSFEFLITCGSGTYIRSLCRDLATSSNTVATMTFLERIESGVFKVEQSVTLQQLEKDGVEKHIESIEKVFSKFDTVEVDDIEKTKLLNGQTIIKSCVTKAENVFVKTHDCELLGLAKHVNGKLKLQVHLYEERE